MAEMRFLINMTNLIGNRANDHWHDGKALVSINPEKTHRGIVVYSLKPNRLLRN